MGSLDPVAGWVVPNAAAAVVVGGQPVETIGDTERRFRLASITKVLTGWAAMIAVEEGLVALETAVGQPGCTLRHLLAHAGGYGFDGPDPISPPGRRRIYSNTGIELAAAAVADAAGMPFGEYLAAAVIEPLGMAATSLEGSPAHGIVSSVADLVRLVAELQAPRLLSPAGATAAVTTHYPPLAGIVPGVGRFDPCPWGLGIEVRGEKSPHWTGTTNAPATFGHFGGAGTMMWVDPVAGRALIALADRSFDQWPEARDEWSRLSDRVIAAA